MRELTEDEVTHYLEHGWVKLERLVSPELAEDLYCSAREHAKPAEGFGWLAENLAASGVEPFRSFVMSEIMGRNVQRLFNRKRLDDADVAVRWRDDLFMHKEPGTAGIPYHQDSAEHGSDRAGELQFWLALGEVTPEMGSMRFVERSHREGLLGSTAKSAGDDDMLELYPRLVEVLGLSPPLHYRAGDASVHHGYTVHGSSTNETDRPRLNMLLSYAPADTR